MCAGHLPGAACVQGSRAGGPRQAGEIISQDTGADEGADAALAVADLKIRCRPPILAYRPRRVVCPGRGVRVEQLAWADRCSRVPGGL